MAKESSDEKMVAEDEMARDKGSLMTKQPGVESTLPPGMPRPTAEGEMNMGGVHKGYTPGGSDAHLGNSDMGSAVAQLNYETERGSHAPSVAGDAAAGKAHHGIMTKD